MPQNLAPSAMAESIKGLPEEDRLLLQIGLVLT